MGWRDCTIACERSIVSNSVFLFIDIPHTLLYNVVICKKIRRGHGMKSGR